MAGRHYLIWYRIEEGLFMSYLKDKKKILFLGAMLILTAVTSVIAFACGINPPIGNVAGAFASFLAAVIVCMIFKVSDQMYYHTLAFVYFASPVGSVLNFYRSIGPYDKIVHFFSGVLIAAFGYMIIWNMINKNNVDKNEHSKLRGVSVLFSMLASGAGAGIWEIMEFTMDIIASGTMQRGMVDTITDMIAGDLGGICYGLVMLYMGRKSFKER